MIWSAGTRFATHRRLATSATPAMRIDGGDGHAYF
jgi:hypothetical protein